MNCPHCSHEIDLSPDGPDALLMHIVRHITGEEKKMLRARDSNDNQDSPYEDRINRNLVRWKKWRHWVKCQIEANSNEPVNIKT